ncbi:MAG: Fe-S cluster assembly ATPase SufC [Chloroflexota bacterium]|jgi:Fe-S cluster assembly ATP-binding protein|nr:Fe-S cluster assembly ATPase SufC [Chloroflexota bacterium]
MNSNGDSIQKVLQIDDLHVSVDDVGILKGINLSVNRGEIHAIMGPNGSGKSTLANVLAGRPEFNVTSGQAIYQGKNLFEMPPEERAREGVFLAFQYPVELAGVRTWQFLKSSVDAIRRHKGYKDLSIREFDRLLESKRDLMKIDADMIKRSVNEGYSGGEKKRNEVLQLALLDPTLAVLDETDSGLDIDALKIVADGVNSFHSDSKAVILVTHYQRILDYVNPDFVHVLMDGKIVRSGNRNLALELEAKGYDWVKGSK